MNSNTEPDVPDRQHEPPTVCTDDPVDFTPGEGHADLGELPADIPGPDEVQ